jgi:hypothetical protein
LFDQAAANLADAVGTPSIERELVVGDDITRRWVSLKWSSSTPSS